MARPKDSELLHEVAVRLVAAHLTASGATHLRTADRHGVFGSGVDIAYERDGSAHRAKVKADPYFGKDPALIADHSLPFYRADSGSYALETISDASTRSPGWLVTSEADEVLYLFLAIRQKPHEIALLLERADEAGLGGLLVERSELHRLPKAAMRTWVESTQEAYPARPVTAGDRASWVRLVPVKEAMSAVPGIAVLGGLEVPR